MKGMGERYIVEASPDLLFSKNRAVFVPPCRWTPDPPEGCGTPASPLSRDPHTGSAQATQHPDTGERKRETTRDRKRIISTVSSLCEHTLLTLMFNLVQFCGAVHAQLHRKNWKEINAITYNNNNLCYNLFYFLFCGSWQDDMFNIVYFTVIGKRIWSCISYHEYENYILSNSFANLSIHAMHLHFI